MNRPHRLTSLAAGGNAGRAMARAELAGLLRACGHDVTATAAAVEPPVTPKTVHAWIGAWGMRAAHNAAVLARRERSRAPKRILDQ